MLQEIVQEKERLNDNLGPKVYNKRKKVVKLGHSRRKVKRLKGF